jgi:hypothetical protein
LGLSEASAELGLGVGAFSWNAVAVQPYFGVVVSFGIQGLT